MSDGWKSELKVSITVRITPASSICLGKNGPEVPMANNLDK
jgi:hypothetical protein